MLRRSVFESRPIIRYSSDYPYAEDYQLWTELASRGFRFANIPEVLLRYRRSDTQVTERYFDVMYTSGLRIQMDYAEQVIEQIATKEERYFNYFT